jgi:hypothetical protein
MLDRRTFFYTAFAGGALLLTRRAGAVGAPAGKLVIYKTPTCGCCQKWVEHVRASNFQTEVHDLESVDHIKARYGVPADLATCHTALIDNYVIEGHVPADAITKLLKEKPAVRGIAVPGMPAGSPGMEMGARKDRYEIIAFDKAGKKSVFARR